MDLDLSRAGGQMTKFTIDVPVITSVPSVSVDAGLAVGSHRFRLEVVDSAGNVSKPAEAVVRIQTRLVDPVGPSPIDEPNP